MENDDKELIIKESKVARLAPSMCDKLCLVCGDRALGFNFGAVSCESCKAFFRRNAIKNKISKCLFTNSCPIDIHTRRFCPDCRLQKCRLIGMKKELILGEEKKSQRKKSQCKSKKIIVMHNSLQEQSQDSLYSLCASTEERNSQKSPFPSVFLSEKNEYEKVEIVQPHHCLNELKQTFLNSGSNSESSTDLYRKLTTLEDNLLNELVQIYDLSFTIDLEPLIHIRQLDPTLNQLVNQSSITVLRLIKFAKRLDEFARLDQVCQIGMLKGCWIHILFLRSLSLYDCDRDVWATPRGDIPTDILKNATGFVELHDDHVRYCKSIKSIIGDDITIVVVLIVIVLFSPEEVNVHGLARQAISDIQDKYLVLLKHYLESRYTYGSSAEMFPALMTKVKELKQFAERHGKCLVDINPHEIEPIMLEILDLK